MFDLKCVGLDVFVISPSGVPKIPERFQDFKLEMISCRGMKCWPGPVPDGVIVDWFRCRYLGEGITDQSVKLLLQELEKSVVWEKVQKLWHKNGQDLFSKAYES